MSTVTTRLCHYGHEDCHKHTDPPAVGLTPKQQQAQKAHEAYVRNTMRRHLEIVATIEEMLAVGAAPETIATRLGYTKLPSLRRHLYNHDRGDLARRLRGDWHPPSRVEPPKCGHAGCVRPAVWVEDNGLDVDDEPIAHWGYLCRRCQAFENLAEDVEFLLKHESSVFNICTRVGYEPSTLGLEALRQRLKRHGRIDLRDRLDIESVKPLRRWHLQGTFHSPRSAPQFRGNVTNGAMFDPVGATDGLDAVGPARWVF